MSFAIGVFHPKCKENIGTLLRSAQNFGANLAFVIGERYRRQPGDTQAAFRHMPVIHFKDWDEAKNHLPMDWTPIAVEILADATSLPEFKHPKSAIYFFGPEDGDIPQNICGHWKNKVRIPTLRCLNLAVAGSIVMYDRIAKESS